MNAAKENTFRALRDEELLVTSFWCRFGWHTWTKYREPELVREGIYKLTIQERRCGSCNVANRRVLNKD
jgi:hypothetical protein